MKTAERLQGYFDFNPEIIDDVAEFAEYQGRFDNYKDFFGAVGIPEVQVIPGSKGTTVVDLQPDEYDPDSALILHLPMANPLDANQLMQVATIAGTNPEKRVIAFGNPCSGQYKGLSLDRKERKMVLAGNLDPLVIDGVRYLEGNGIEHTDEAGYSYGALKVIAAAAAGKHFVRTITAIEPVTPARSLPRLAANFSSTNSSLSKYTQAPELPIYRQARDNDMSDLEFYRALARPTNLAVARMLANTDIREQAGIAVFSQPEAEWTLSWGSESEMAKDEAMQALAEDIEAIPIIDSVQRIRLEGQKHALANDIHLHAALVRQGIAAQ